MRVMENQLLRKVHWKHLMLFLVCLVSMNQVHAQYYHFEAESDGSTIYYTARGTSATVVSGDEQYSGNVIIPSTVSYDGKDFTIVAVGSFAFSECADLNSVSLPSSLLSIGDYAFYGCTSIKAIVVPNAVTAIGSNAFDGCTNLSSVTLSSSLKSIEYHTFANCRSLRTLEIPNSVRKIGDMAFQNCGLLSTISIPNSVTSIGTFAFEKCSSLESLTIPNQLTSIEQYTFAGCSRLTTLEIPSSVTFIDEWAFYDCSGLKTVTIPNSVSYIGEWAFTSCDAITSVISEIESPFNMSEYVFERDIKKQATLRVPAGSKEAYLCAAGWDFKNIEEEEPSFFDLVMWAKDGSMIATYALSGKPKVTFNENKFVVECEGLEIDYYELDILARFTYEKNTVTAIRSITTDKGKFAMNGGILTFSSLKANSTISIYSLNGTLVFRKTIPQAGEYALNIANLNVGVYMVNVNGSTYKIMKK